MIFSEQLMYLIDGFAERVGIVIDWTNDNIMPYLSDLITRYSGFHLATNSIMFFVCLLTVLSCAWGWLTLVEYLKSDDFHDFFDLNPITIVALFTLTVLSLIGVFHFGNQAIKLLFIPEWFILEQLQGLM